MPIIRLQPSLWIIFVLGLCSHGISQNRLSELKTIAIADLSNPQSISISPLQEIVITDQNSGSIRVISLGGGQPKDIKSITISGKPVSLNKPRFVVAGTNQLIIFDEGVNKFYSIDLAELTGHEFGQPGQSIGQIGEPADMVISPDGFLHVLNLKKNIIDIYSPERNYMTWVAGNTQTFFTPKSISVDVNNRLYVLDLNGPVIHVLDANGQLLTSLNKLIDEQNRPVSKANSIAADNSGGFFVTTDDGALLWYGDDGKLKNHFRNSQRLKKPVALAVSPNQGTLAVLDAQLKAVQVFTYDLPELHENLLNRPTLYANTNIGLDYYRATAQGTSAYYYIPYARRDQLIGMSVTGRQKFAIDGYFKEASDILWTDHGVYVLEEKSRDIFQFSQDGKLIRKFGPELADKTKKPSSFAAFKNGDLIVNDQGKNNLIIFNHEGKFLNQISLAGGNALESIRVNRQNEVLAFDTKSGGIIKADITGKLLSTQILKPRSDKPGGQPGEIGYFTVDPLDQVHLYNLSTYQFEVYIWKDQTAQRVFSAGSEGDDWFKFNKPKFIALNPSDFELQFISNKGKVFKYHYYFQPPQPENLFGFDVVRDQLKVAFKPVNSNLVTAYGLVTALPSGLDTLMFGSNSDHFLVDIQKAGWSDKPKRYHLVTVNPTAISPKTEGFDDFFSQAKYFDKEEKFDEALLAYQKALIFMGRPAGMIKFVAGRYNLMGKKIALMGDMHKAMNFIKTAFNLNPLNTDSQRSLAYGYDLLFWKLATQENYPEIIKQAESVMDIDPLRPPLLASIDSVASTLENLANERSLNHARLLRIKMTEWEPNSTIYLSKLGSTNMRLIDLRLRHGAPQSEMDALLYETERSQKKTIEILQKLKRPYVTEYIQLLNILKMSGKYQNLEQEARTLIKEQSVKLTEDQLISARTLLAEGLIGQNKYTEATNEYEYLVSARPGQKNLLAGLAEVHYLNKNYNTARTLYLDLLTSDRENPDYIGKLGLIEFQKENYIEASFQLEKAVRLNPLEKTYYGPLGEAFDQASNLQKALENYKVAIDYYEQQIQQIKNRSAANLTLQDATQQLMVYQNKIGKVYEKLGQFDLAISAYKRVVSHDANNAAAQYGLGISSLSTGLIYDAVKALFIAKNLQPNDETYTNAYQNAVKMREQISKNSEPLSLSEIQIPAIFPSLYQNYSQATQLPLGNLVITNNMGEPITPSSLTLFIPGLMEQPTHQKAGALVGYSNSSINLTALFNENILKVEQTATHQLQIKLSYRYQGTLQSTSKEFPVTIHPRNAITWSDKRRLGSFILPSNPVLTGLQQKIEQLYKLSSVNTVNPALNIAVQVYTYLNHYGLKYVADPNLNYATVSANTSLLDYLQFPAETLQRKTGDCDDLVALYCAAMEASGQRVAYLDLPGHVMMAFDLGTKPERLSELGLLPQEVIVYDQSVWIPIETTLLGQAGFITAWDKAAQRYYLEIAKGNHPELVTLADARKVYQPASFTPPNFTLPTENRNNILNEYTEQVYRLSSKINAGVMTELQNQMEAEPNNIYLKNKHAILLAKSGETNRAQEVLLKALEIAPESPSIQNNLGNIYYQQGDYQTAIKHYQKAHQFDNEDVQTLVNLGKAFLAIDNKEEAKKWFDLAISMNKNLTSFISKLINN